MRCPICGAEPSELFAAKYVDVAKCGNVQCGHIWAVGVPDDHGIQTIDDPHQLQRQYEKRDFELAKFLVQRGFIGPGSALLDVGAGSGHLSAALLKSVDRLHITAVEADPVCLGRLKTEGFAAYGSLEEVGGASFDAITLVEVVEHLSDPVAVLQALHSLLKPRGKVFCTTPCGELRSGSRSTNAYDTSEHVQFFTEKSLSLCFSKAGYGHFGFETINEMTSSMSPQPSRFVKDLLRPLRAALVGHVHLTGFAQA